MPISGTVPFYDFSTVRMDSVSAILATVTGAITDGQVTNANSNETFTEFLARGITALSISGQQSVSGVTSGLNGQVITSGQLSGVMQYQRELAFRIADIQNLGAGNPARLIAAQTALASPGEVQFGS